MYHIQSIETSNPGGRRQMGTSPNTARFLMRKARVHSEEKQRIGRAMNSEILRWDEGETSKLSSMQRTYYAKRERAYEGEDGKPAVIVHKNLREVLRFRSQLSCFAVGSLHSIVSWIYKQCSDGKRRWHWVTSAAISSCCWARTKNHCLQKKSLKAVVWQHEYLSGDLVTANATLPITVHMLICGALSAVKKFLRILDSAFLANTAHHWLFTSLPHSAISRLKPRWRLLTLGIADLLPKLLSITFSAGNRLAKENSSRTVLCTNEIL